MMDTDTCTEEKPATRGVDDRFGDRCASDGGAGARAGAASPRHPARATTLTGAVIHTSVVVLWFVLFARAFFLHGALAWSTGIAYVLYDTVLLLFVGLKTLPLAGAPSKPLDLTGRLAVCRASGVIVASHNEASVLTGHDRRAAQADHGPAQIVIADDGSTDGTRALLTSRFGLIEPAEGELSAASSLYPATVLAAGAAWRQGAGAERRDHDDDDGHRDDRQMPIRCSTTTLPTRCSARSPTARTSSPAAGILLPVCSKTVSGPGCSSGSRRTSTCATSSRVLRDARRQPVAGVGCLCHVSGATRCSRWAVSIRSVSWRITN